jgi:hypothetical protein
VVQPGLGDLQVSGLGIIGGGRAGNRPPATIVLWANWVHKPDSELTEASWTKRQSQPVEIFLELT